MAKRAKKSLPELKMRADSLARLALSPAVRSASCATHYAASTSGLPELDFKNTLDAVANLCVQVRQDDMSGLMNMLTAQAFLLDTVFTEYSRRAILVQNEFPPTAQSYAKLAAAAQANCRTTIETIARMRRGGRQTVKVIHVHQGAQAVVAGTINQGG